MYLVIKLDIPDHIASVAVQVPQLVVFVIVQADILMLVVLADLTAQ